MKVHLVDYESLEFARILESTGAIKKTGSVTLTKKSMFCRTVRWAYWDDNDESKVAAREFNIFKTHLNAEDFWNKTRRELSVFLKIHPSKRNSMHLKVQGDCLTDLCRIFGSDCKLQLKLRNDGNKILDSNEIPITNESNDACKRSKYDAYCENKEIEISDDMFSWMAETSMNIKIRVSVTGSFSKSICDADVSNKSSIYSKMLNEKIETDVVVVANDGTSIPCLKAFLIAQSTEFAKILQNHKEKKTKSIKTDIPAWSLKPFLEYIYSYEVSGPIGDPQIAIDLLKYSQKYKVKAMETKMAKILYECDEDAFTLDETIQLLFLVRNKGKVGNYDLERKAFGMVEDMNVGNVFQSEEFKNFFESPAAFETVTEIMRKVSHDCDWKLV